MYSNLEKALDGKDVLLNASGINLHPEFVRNLPVFSVFQCADDPENSHNLSKPAAFAYDLSLVINIAEVDTYRSWGIGQVEWIPHPGALDPAFYDSNLTYDVVLNGRRDIDLFMMADRLAPWRKARMDQLALAFPDAYFYGNGWERGFLPKSQEKAVLGSAKITPNVHNSTGPVNIRTYTAPANGIMLICDNKHNLGNIYELGKEAVGFDTIEECIELCHYYLAHDDERRLIAANGWKRAVTDYNEIAVFQRSVDIIEHYMKRAQLESVRARQTVLAEQYRATRWLRFHYQMGRLKRLGKRFLVSMVKRLINFK